MANNTNKTGLIYWLEKIFNAISGIGGSVITAQSDWEETDETSPKYINNKPVIPAKSGIVVEGAVAEQSDDFIPAAGAPTFAEVYAAVENDGASVWFYYAAESVYDLVTNVAVDDVTKKVVFTTAGGVVWTEEDTVAEGETVVEGS